MAEAPVTPCEPWPAVLCCDVDGIDPAVVDAAVAGASHALWARTGRRYGVCPATVRPCLRRCASGLGGWWEFGASGYPTPAYYNGQWYNITCGCGSDCSCTEVCEIDLPGGRVVAITSVTLNGVVLTDGVDYRVDNWSRLVRLGGGCWPLCQDMTAGDNDPGAFAVSWTYGVEVPPLGQQAVGELACELIKACTGDKRCRLPQRVQSMSREGITFTVIDSLDFLDGGLTGLPVVDLFIRTDNPHGLSNASAVWSPDRTGIGRVAGT